MGKVSEGLASRIKQEAPETAVDLNVLVRKEIDAARAQDVLSHIKRFITADSDLEFSPLFQMAEVRTTLGAVHEIAKHPDVIHVAENRKQEMRDLIDM